MDAIVLAILTCSNASNMGPPKSHTTACTLLTLNSVPQGGTGVCVLTCSILKLYNVLQINYKIYTASPPLSSVHIQL
jgi:hypothetical protein